MKKISLILMFVLSFEITSQTNEDNTISSFWDFYGNNYLNTIAAGRGFTGVASENDISGIILNPATIELKTKYQVNAQYTFKTKQSWLSSDNLGLKQQLFSGSVGLGFRINKYFQTGFVYNNPTGWYMGSEVIRTDEFGNEIGRYDFYINTQNHSFNLPLTYTNKNFKAGLNLNYAYSRYTIPKEGVFKNYPPFEYTTGNDFTASGSIFKLQAGFVFIILNNLSLGAKIEIGGTSNIKYIYPDGVTTDSMISKHPWRISSGIQYLIPKSSWKLLFYYNYSNTSESILLNDRYDINFGIENEINRNLIIRGGFFTLSDYRNKGIEWLEPVSRYNQFFLTFGFSYNEKNMTLNLAVLSSQLSPGSIKNIYINGGVTFNF